MARPGRSRSYSPDKPSFPSTAREDHYISGRNPVSEALKSGTKIRTLFVHRQSAHNLQPIIGLAEARQIPVKFVEKDFFDTRFDKGHQGIAAAAAPKEVLDIDDLLDQAFAKSKAPFFIVLDCIEDPRNFGAILRVADATGVDGVIFQSRRSAGLTPAVYKSSAGAIEHVNLAEVVNIKHAVASMKERDVAVIGAEASAPLSLWQVDMKVALAVIVGSEGEGMRRTVKEMCDTVVNLPMKGTVNSLNVSVAAGVIAYEVMRQRINR
ncbi:MAG: 23S rRNA (guanosine(2251)-2'-O)-methyltransferase RlmB [Dissulfurispiraceae bacterium]|jgi:23S rRNA (guanosine2251-2'-O)-methyltransferase